jgi:hypothetical protein
MQSVFEAKCRVSIFGLWASGIRGTTTSRGVVPDGGCYDVGSACL